MTGYGSNTIEAASKRVPQAVWRCEFPREFETDAETCRTRHSDNPGMKEAVRLCPGCACTLVCPSVSRVGTRGGYNHISKESDSLTQSLSVGRGQSRSSHLDGQGLKFGSNNESSLVIMSRNLSDSRTPVGDQVNHPPRVKHLKCIANRRAAEPKAAADLALQVAPGKQTQRLSRVAESPLKRKKKSRDIHSGMPFFLFLQN